MVNLFELSEIFLVCFLAIFDLEHDVEALFHLF